jgi:hypothetical protein
LRMDSRSVAITPPPVGRDAVLPTTQRRVPLGRPSRVSERPYHW